MSSPPNFSLSPPYPGNLTLPKKRPAGSASSPSSAKRRKPSTSSSSHPLRQTSFPPPETFSATSRAQSFSPTVDESVNGGGTRSLAGTSSIGGRGKRGRKRAADAYSTTVTSAAGTRAFSAAADGAGSASGINGGGGRDDYEGDEDDGEGEGLDDAVEEVKEDEAAQKMAAEHMAMLVNAFDRDQTERYNVWRRIKLKKETVRRITNQTLSQSVSQPVIMVINGYTKSFIGELIDRARDVQTEWLTASPLLPTGESKIKHDALRPNSRITSSDAIHSKYEPGEKRSDGAPFEQSSAAEEKIRHWDTLGSEKFGVEERDRGPLTPDHLREALRRYKKDREGGSAGFQGLSHYGREALAPRAGGKRLFR